MEKLLLAVKIRWYINIGKGPVLSEDDEVAASFDREHGGILNAISAGLFPYFLKKNDEAEKDFAFLKDEILEDGRITLRVVELVNGERSALVNMGTDNNIIGALNGIYAKGYALDEDPIYHDWPRDMVSYTTFSRRRHSVLHSSATNIFIPTNDEIEKQKEANCTKQFACHVKDMAESSEKIVVSDILNADDPDPYSAVEITEQDDVELWLEKHNFLTREKKIEELFVVKSSLEQIKGGDHPSAVCCLLYSRQIPRVQQGG